jgi:hypothetical protein
MQDLKMQQVENDENTWLVADNLPYEITFMLVSAYYVIGRHPGVTDHRYLVLHYDQLMIICDTVSARIFTLWYNYTLPDTDPRKIPEDILITVYSYMDEALIDQKNQASRQLTLFKLMRLAVMLNKFQPIRKSGEFLK